MNYTSSVLSIKFPLPYKASFHSFQRDVGIIFSRFHYFNVEFIFNRLLLGLHSIISLSHPIARFSSPILRLFGPSGRVHLAFPISPLVGIWALLETPDSAAEGVSGKPTSMRSSRSQFPENRGMSAPPPHRRPVPGPLSGPSPYPQCFTNGIPHKGLRTSSFPSQAFFSILMAFSSSITSGGRSFSTVFQRRSGSVG
jgi:hypothetical protein